MGGTRVNAFPITDPRKQVDAAVWNAVQWQVAGMNKLAPLVSLTVDAAGAKTAGGEAWNTQDDSTKRVTINRTGTGVFVIATQAASYKDWRGVDGPDVPVVFTGVQVTPITSSDVRGVVMLDSATQVTVRLRNAGGSLIDCAFTVDIR